VALAGLAALCFLLRAVIDGFLTTWDPIKYYRQSFRNALNKPKSKPIKPMTLREKMEAEGKW